MVVSLIIEHSLLKINYQQLTLTEPFDKEYKEPGLLEYVKMILDRISGW